MLNCKPGDLAVIVNSRATPENIGKIVRVIRLAVHNEKIEGHYITLRKDAPAWIVESAGSDLVWRGFLKSDGSQTKHIVRIRSYADRCLRPIRDPGDDAVDQFARKIEDYA